MSTPEAEIEALVGAGGDADDILRAVVAALAKRYGWAGVLFVEDDDLVLGPEAGGPAPDADRRTQIPVTWQGDRVAELVVAAAPGQDRAFLERVAGLVAPQCLVGWDTGGEDWDP